MEDRAPTAVVIAPAAAEAYALLAFDGSGSADPDDGDAITSYAWTFAAVDASCDPPTVAGTGATAQVRFGCAGRFRVDLVVLDEKGRESAPASAEVVVAEQTGDPVVAVGADQAVAHACSGSPLLCTTAGGDRTVHASVASSAAVGPVAYRWTVEAPSDRPLDATRRVELSPGADVASPSVHFETDGTAISGDWVLRVIASDSAGPLGEAAVRISIANRAPTVALTASNPYAHTYDEATSAFASTGTIAAAVADPDGDPIASRTATWYHSDDGGNAFQGGDLGSELSFLIYVPYATAADAAYLRGDPGPTRRVVLQVADVNGAGAEGSADVVVGNRAPAPAAAAATASVSHTYSAPRYLAYATGAQWEDLDGDPLVQAGSTGDADCSTFSVQHDGTTQIACARGFSGTLALSGFVGTHTVAESVKDPWATAAVTSSTAVTIGNRAPVAADTTYSAALSCSSYTGGSCCKDPEAPTVCDHWPYLLRTSTVTADPDLTDADGDPLLVTWYGDDFAGTTVCEPTACRATMAITSTSTPKCKMGVSGSGTFSATDGLAATATRTLSASWACSY